MNYSLFLSVVFLVCLFGSSHAAGMINVTFTPEDPTSTQVVLADIALGDSLEGTIILTPAPTKPLRFTIVSTVPQIISASHARVTFKTGQTEGKFTLASDSSTGQIGFVTVVISPEIPGTYVPTSFDVLVRGYSSASFAANTGCIASGIAAEIQVTLNPIAPEAVTFVAQTSNGIVSPTTYTVPIGQSEATFSVTGVAIGASVVTFTSNLYLPVTVNFNTYGQIKTTKSSTLIAGAPSTVTVSTVPTNTLSLAVTTTSSNLDVTPSSFTLAAAGTTSVEVIASSSGVATLSFSASSYCTHTDVFTVNASPICSTGFSAIIDGSECAICPGNSEVTDVYSNTCYGNGDCTYSSCSSTSTRCVCDSPYVGFACQYNNDTDVFYVFTIDNVAFNVTVEGLTGAQSVLFSVPDNAIAERNIGGDIIFAPYSASNAVFVDPSSNPPSSTSSTEIGWRFEVTCSDNTVDDSTTSPIGVVIDVDSDTYSQYQLALTNLYYFDETTQSWVDAAEYCDSDVYSVDMTEFTITTQICVPGQYNIFVSPPPPLPANTGNPFNPFPTAVSGDRSTTGVTGNNPIAPPLPVFTVTEGDPSPAQKLVDNNLYGSSSILSYSPLLLAILLIFLF